MNESPATKRIVIAGAGYAGLHVALRLGSWLEKVPEAEIALVDKFDYHQVLTELPRVASGSRSDDSVRVPLETVLPRVVGFTETTITGFDIAHSRLLTEAGAFEYWRLVLALGSRPNDFNIPGLSSRVLYLWSVDDATRVWEAVQRSVESAAATEDPAEQRCLLTVVIGGAGATGIELAGALAEELPVLARQHGLSPDLCRVVVVEGGPTILGGSSPGLISRAQRILDDLRVNVRTNAMIAEATARGFVLKHGEVIEGGVFVWAGGVKAPDLVRGSGLPIGYNGRVKVDENLRALDHPDIYVAGDVASVIDPATGRAVQPLAQVALAEGETVAANLQAELEGKALERFSFHSKGIVVSVGGKRGVADVAGRTLGGRLASVLKDTIEWEYKQSVKHLRGWSVV
ncbi:MAG: NAD(P)/FAD-dependent oxidoreductase [Chloroflexota bacterium]